MTNAVIGALRVNLGIDTAQFQDGLKKAQSSMPRFAKAAKVAFAAVGAAATAMAAAFANGIRQTINEADKLGDVADMLGVNVESLQELRYAADRAGMGVQNFDVALRRFIRRASEASQGTGAAKGAFEELGVSLRNNHGQLKDSDTLLGEVADAMRNVKNPSDKLRLAFQMFDTDGAAMVNVLAGGSAGLAKMRAEAQSLGIVLNESTVRAAQSVKDNFDMVGYAVHGVTVSLTAALAPALVMISDAMVVVARAFVDALSYLPTLAEYAAVAGGALALMFSPAILAAIGNMTLAIGVGLVGAVRLLTAVIAANPLGALAVAIAGAVTAVYYFRDEIQKAIGIDVVGIVKDGANLIINSFRACFEDIKLVWAQLPNIIGGAVVGAVNAAINGINVMVKAAKTALNQIIELANHIPGVDIGLTDTSAVAINPMENTFATELSQAVADRNARISEIMASDPIGQIGKAFSASTPAVLNMNTALGQTGDILDDLGGGGGKGKKGGGGKVAKLKDSFDKVGQAVQSAQEALGQGFSGILEGLIDKSLSWKDALLQAGKALLKYLNQMNMAQGGKGLFGGGLLQGLIGGLVGFASGGTILPGGSGGIDGQLVAFRKSPNEQVDITKPGQRRGGSNYAPVYNIDARGADQAAVARIQRGLEERDRNFGKMVDQRVDTRRTRGTRG